MTLRTLLTKTSYKNIFNEIHKEYLKHYSKNKIELFSVNLQRSHDCLKKLPKKKCKNSIKIESVADTYCIHICNEDDYAVLDFIEWSDLIDCEVIAPKKISDSKLAGLILWDITFWGYSPQEIRENKDKVKQQAINGESFLLQDYKDRSKRLI